MSTTPESLHTALQAYPHARLKKYGVVAVVPEERASVLAVSSANPVAREVIVCVDGHFLRSWVPVDGGDQTRVARLVSTASRLRRGDALPVAAPRALVGANVYDFHPRVPEVALTLDRVTPSRPTVLHLRLKDGPRTKRPAEAENNRGRLVAFPLHAVDRARTWAAAFAAAYPSGGSALVVNDQVEVPDVALAWEADPRPAAEDTPDPGRAARVVHAWRTAAAALDLGGDFPGLSEAESGLSELGLLGGADQGAQVSPSDAAAGRLWLDDEHHHSEADHH